MPSKWMKTADSASCSRPNHDHLHGPRPACPVGEGSTVFDHLLEVYRLKRKIKVGR